MRDWRANQEQHEYKRKLLCQISHQRQSEAEASCSGFRRPIEPRIEIENAFDPILRDSDSVIVNFDANLLVRAFPRNLRFRRL